MKKKEQTDERGNLLKKNVRERERVVDKHSARMCVQ